MSDEIPQPALGRPANDLMYQPVWGAEDAEPCERDSTPARAKLVFDALDPAGKDVLDLGCARGYFCFEAIHRGARRVHGVDYYAPAIAAAPPAAVA